VPGPTGTALLFSWLGWGRLGVRAGSPFFVGIIARRPRSLILHVVARLTLPVAFERNARGFLVGRDGAGLSLADLGQLLA